jgi:colanic acid/amylovoran biosynthesis glycosyltransferase
MKMSSARAVAYLLTQFPALSETFVLNEVVKMAEQGLEVTVWSMRRPGKKDLYNDQVKSIRDNIRTIPFWDPRVLLLFPLFLLAHPISVIWVLIQTIRHQYPHPGTLLRSLVVLPAVLYYGNQMQRRLIEHLHVHFATTPAWGAWVIKTVYGISWSMTVHAHDIYLNHDMLQKKMDSAEFMVTNSQYNIDYLRKVHPGYPNEKLHLIHTGIDTGRFQPLATEITADILQILAVGRLDPTKGYRYLVEVVRELSQRGIKTCTHVVGHITDEAYVQAEYKAIQRLIHDYRLEDSITFEQGIPQDLLLQRYQEAALFLLPCVVDETGNSDGLPSVLVEAMLLQKPIISTRISGIPELVITDQTGWLCEPGNVKELADACESIIRQPELAAVISAQGRQHALENWDLALTSKQMYQLLAESL